MVNALVSVTVPMTQHPGAPATTPALLATAVARAPADLAVIDGATRLSYGELAELVAAVAGGLIDAGIVPGDRVGIWAPNTYHWIVAALALHTAGAVLVPVNTRYLGREAADVLSRADVRALFVPDQFLGRSFVNLLRDETAGEGTGGGTGPVPGLPSLSLVVAIPVEGTPPARADGVVSWDALVETGRGVPTDVIRVRGEAVGPEDPADILFTSGTTGVPKGAISAHRQTVAVARAWAGRGELSPADRYLVISPFFHSFGYKAGFIAGLTAGAAMVPQLTFNLEEVLNVIEAERISVLPGPPTIFQDMLAAPERAGRDLSSLRLAVTGSAPVPAVLVERMRAELSFSSVLTAYGLSEAVVVTMCRREDEPEVIADTSGFPTADFEVRIVNADGETVGPGGDGEILLRGPNVMLGYLDDPAATAAAIDSDGWLRTGDVGRLNDAGYLTITDRIKNMFTVGGFNVYPAEIEAALARMDDVVESAVIGVPDDRLGEVGAVFVVLRPGATTTSDDVIEYCRANMANFKVPGSVRVVDALPRNAGGKVVRAELEKLR